MCSSNSKVRHRQSNTTAAPITTTLPDINGRRVLQPATSNRNSPLSEPRPLKKTLSLPKSISPIPSPTTKSKLNQSPISPNLKSPRLPAVKRGCNNDITYSSNNLVLPPPAKCTTPKSVIPVKKTQNSTITSKHHHHLHNSIDTSTSTSPKSLSMKYNSASVVDLPGSIAAARREQVAVLQVQRKMRIAHYGRTKSAKYDPNIDSISVTPTIVREQKRCSFITPNSDPIYVAYHDDEWGVPVHDDMMLFELLVLTGAQVGSDWTSVLKKRQHFRDAFAGFNADMVSKYSEKKITSVSSEYCIEVSLVRGVVDNSKSIIEVNKAFGSFNNYIWGFVNHKPIVSQYKSSHKMPVKTSKAEAISKHMVRRGFRQVGPTVIHSFMQAAGLTNDHLTTCPRHHQCVALASPTTPSPLVFV